MNVLSADTEEGLREAMIYLRDAIKIAYPQSGQKRAFEIALICMRREIARRKKKRGALASGSACPGQ